MYSHAACIYRFQLNWGERSYLHGFYALYFNSLSRFSIVLLCFRKIFLPLSCSPLHCVALNNLCCTKSSVFEPANCMLSPASIYIYSFALCLVWVRDHDLSKDISENWDSSSVHVLCSYMYRVPGSCYWDFAKEMCWCWNSQAISRFVVLTNRVPTGQRWPTAAEGRARRRDRTRFLRKWSSSWWPVSCSFSSGVSGSKTVANSSLSLLIFLDSVSLFFIVRYPNVL